MSESPPKPSSRRPQAQRRKQQGTLKTLPNTSSLPLPTWRWSPLGRPCRPVPHPHLRRQRWKSKVRAQPMLGRSERHRMPGSVGIRMWEQP